MFFKSEEGLLLTCGICNSVFGGSWSYLIDFFAKKIGKLSTQGEIDNSHLHESAWPVKSSLGEVSLR